MRKLNKMIYISLLVAFGLALSIVETAMPVIFMIPGAKLGLSNIVVLTTIVIYGLKDGLIVAVLKSLLLMIATGSVTGMFYSLPSGIVSCIIMYFSHKYFLERREVFSLIGISILGSIFHNITQVTVASILLSNLNIYVYLPILILVSLFTGYFVGLASKYVTEKLKKNLKHVGVKE